MYLSIEKKAIISFFLSLFIWYTLLGGVSVTSNLKVIGNLLIAFGIIFSILYPYGFRTTIKEKALVSLVITFLFQVSLQTSFGFYGPGFFFELTPFLGWSAITWLFIFPLTFIDRYGWKRMYFGAARSVDRASERAANNTIRAVGGAIDRAREDERRRDDMDRLGKSIGSSLADSLRGREDSNSGFDIRDYKKNMEKQRKRLFRR